MLLNPPAIADAGRAGSNGSINTYAGHPRCHAKERFVGLAITIALHVAAIWGLLQFGAVHRQIIAELPIMVNFITLPPRIAEPPKPIMPPRPKPIAKIPKPIQRKRAVPPVLATQAMDVPAPRNAEPPKLPEAIPIKVPSAPVASAPAPLIPPEFNAAYLDNPPPIYPPQSKRRHEEGKVFLRVYVNASGAAEKVEINASSGWPRLDAAALETVRSWRFVPAKQGNKAVAAWVIVPINFTVEG